MSIWKRPLTSKHVAIGLAYGTAGLVGLYLSVVGLTVIRSGYAWSDMDWNSDGTTTPLEILDVVNVGSRSVVQGTHECTEFFGLKDGLPVKVVCSG